MEKSLWMICATHMFLEVYLLMQVALIPVIIREFHLGLLEASLVATVPNIIQLLMIIPSGFLADRFSVKSLLFMSMLVEGFSALLISQTKSFWMLVVGAALLKVSSPLYHIAGLSHVSKLAKLEQTSRLMGFHNAFGSLGAAFGVVSLAVFLSILGWRWTYLFWAFPVLIWGFIILIFMRFKTGKFGEANAKGGLKRLSFVFSYGLLILLMVVALREVGYTGSSTFITTYFVDARAISESTASLIFGLGPFMGIVGSLGGGYLGERLGAKKALSYAILGCAVALFMLSLESQLYLLIIVYLVYSFFSYAVWSPLNTLVAGNTSSINRGLGFSVYFFTEGATASIAPTLAAGVIELSEIWYVFPFSIIFMIISLVVLQFLPEKNIKPLM